jgi:hypothetical protein
MLLERCELRAYASEDVKNLPRPDTMLFEQTLLLLGGAAEPVRLILFAVDCHLGI